MATCHLRLTQPAADGVLTKAGASPRDLGKALADVVPTYANPQPLFRTTYLDGQLRVSRDQDGKLFVYSRVSSDTTPTDYADAPADLGIGALLSGMSSSLL